MRYGGSHDTVNGLLADYCSVLSETTFLLRTLAKACDDDERRAEFDALADVHSASRPIHRALLGALASWPEDPGDPWVTNARRLTALLHTSIGSVMRTGTELVDWDAALVPNEVVHQCGLVKSVSASLTRAWEEQHDPVAVERHLWGVQLGLDALDRALNAHQPV